MRAANAHSGCAGMTGRSVGAMTATLAGRVALEPTAFNPLQPTTFAGAALTRSPDHSGRPRHRQEVHGATASESNGHARAETLSLGGEPGAPTVVLVAALAATLLSAAFVVREVRKSLRE